MVTRDVFGAEHQKHPSSPWEIPTGLLIMKKYLLKINA